MGMKWKHFFKLWNSSYINFTWSKKIENFLRLILVPLKAYLGLPLGIFQSVSCPEVALVRSFKIGPEELQGRSRGASR